MRCTSAQAVDDCGLADAGRPHQGEGAPAPGVSEQLLDALARLRAQEVRGHARRDPRDLRTDGVGVVYEVGLVEDDHRLGPALPGHDEVAFETARVVVVVEAHHEEDRVHVGGDDLLDCLAARGLAREDAPARQHLMNLRAARVLRQTPEGDPVAHGRQLLRPRRVIPEPASGLGPGLARRGVEQVNLIVLEKDAAGLVPFGRERRERRGEEVGPAVSFEIVFIAHL
jgi:hypothetical protein